MAEVVIVMGPQASGKTSFMLENFPNHFRINRDTIGGKLDKLDVYLDNALSMGAKQIVLDNTYKTRDSRKTVIDTAKKHGANVTCFWLTTTIADCQVNACLRMMERHGKILSPEETKEAGKKDSNMFPIAALYNYFSKVPSKQMEPPTRGEGFAHVITVGFVRKWGAEYVNRGVILDYDDTIRCVSKDSDCTTKYPTKPEHVKILPNRRTVLDRWLEKGYSLFGASNQSGISKGVLTEVEARACFQKTNELLGLPILVNYCPHTASPTTCYCRKPCPGLLIDHIFKNKLDPKEVIFVGDQTSDRTAAARLGIKYLHESEFFKI